MTKKKNKTLIENRLLAYQYMGFIHDAIVNREPFKYTEVNQLGARESGKTTSDNIELVKAIVAAAKTKQKLFILIVRMHHKDIGEAWEDVIKALDRFDIPYKTWSGKGTIKIWSTIIQVKGCYTTNSEKVSFLGFRIQDAKYGVLVFEEAKELNDKTVKAVLVAARGIRYQTVIYRSNPYLLGNWFVQKCYKKVMVNYAEMKKEYGNQLVIKDDTIYHYMNCWVNPFLSIPSRAYFNTILIDDPLLAETEVWGLPGTTTGMVFARYMDKIQTNFVNQNWEDFVAGVDVGHVSSATAGVFIALGDKATYQISEYYHSNKTMRYKESKELASDIISFYANLRDKYHFNQLDVHVDNSDPGFISLINTTALEQGKHWLLARPCSKIDVSIRISWTIKMLSQGRYHIYKDCKKSLEELSMIAYDEKAEDDRPKLVKQDDHTWDAAMYALIPHMKDYID